MNLEFIGQIGLCAVKAYKELGKVKPSVCIAMGIVESAWGTAGSVKHHSYLGQKRGTGMTARKYWNGTSFNARTQECYDQESAALTTILDRFRSYESMEQCVFNYYELLNTKLYSGVTECEPYDQIQQIKDCGYFTSTTEVSTVRKLIEEHDLERYDSYTVDDFAAIGVEVEKPSEVVNPELNLSPRFSGIVEMFEFLKMDSSFDNRKIVAEKCGCNDYKGTSEQNDKLMHYMAVQCLGAAYAVLGR